MSRNWDNWPPNLCMFIGYAGLSSLVSGLEIIVGARILASYGHGSYEHLTGRDGFNLGALSGAIQAPCMATIFWPYSVVLNYKERERILKERDVCKLLMCMFVVSLVTLGANTASAYALDAERDIGRAMACHFVSPIVGIFYAMQVQRIFSSSRPLSEMQDVNEDVERANNVANTLGCSIQ